MRRILFAVIALVFCLGVFYLVAMPQSCDPPGGGMRGAAEGSSLSGTAVLDVEITSDAEIAGVDYYLDDCLAGSVNSAPYALKLDTTQYKNKEFTCYAKIRAYGRPDGVTEKFIVKIDNSATDTQ